MKLKLLLLTVFPALWIAISSQAAVAAEKISVFVSVLPQKYFVEQVGGEQVDVNVMVQAGDNPATYEPSPRQISKLSKAALYIRVGVPFESAWMGRIQAVNTDMRLIDARDGIEQRQLPDHDHHAHDADSEHDTQHDAEQENDLDPHSWTSPLNVITMSAQIRDVLSELRPESADIFAANQQAFVQQLQQLHQELQTEFSDIPTKKFMVFHPSWGYMADLYGLEQVAIESDGKEPGAQQLSQLIQQARSLGIKTIFVQPQFDERAAKQVAKAIDGQVVALDPLAEDYPQMMRTAAQRISGKPAP